MNDYEIDYNEDELENLVFSIAEGKTKKDKIALFLSKTLG
jgi:prophage maintenance system killer protein